MIENIIRLSPEEKIEKLIEWVRFIESTNLSSMQLSQTGLTVKIENNIQIDHLTLYEFFKKIEHKIAFIAKGPRFEFPFDENGKILTKTISVGSKVS